MVFDSLFIWGTKRTALHMLHSSAFLNQNKEWVSKTRAGAFKMIKEVDLCVSVRFSIAAILNCPAALGHAHEALSTNHATAGIANFRCRGCQDARIIPLSNELFWEESTTFYVAWKIHRHLIYGNEAINDSFVSDKPQYPDDNGNFPSWIPFPSISSRCRPANNLT